MFEKYGNVIEIILPKDRITGDRAGELQLLEDHILFLLLWIISLLITSSIHAYGTLCSLLFC